MLANSFENARDRYLIIIFMILFFMSFGVHIKQVLDITKYQKLLNETQHMLSEAMNYTPISVIVHTLTATQDTPAVANNKTKVIELKEVKQSDLNCMAENIYYEAGNQGIAGKMAVGQVVLNRVGKSGYPKTVCGVINHKIGDTCMFSWKCSPQTAINKNSREWRQSVVVAQDLLSKDRKDILDITEGATHFHNHTVRPNWKMHRVAKIGDHTFYK